MALKRTGESAVAERAGSVFDELRRRRERGEINKTVTISFRVLESERERITKIMNENGYSLAAGSKKAVYDFIKTLAKD